MLRDLMIFSFCTLLFSCATQRYQRVHKNAFLVDTHNDLLSSVTLEGMDIANDLKGKAHSDLARMKQGGLDLQVFSIFCDEKYGNGTAYNYAMREIDSLSAIAERNPAKLKLIANPQDLNTNANYIQALMGVEGGHMIEEDLSKLDSFFNRGVRYMTLTWNNSVSWASSAKDENAKTELNHKYGLNEFGEKVVRKMNALGMIVDVSHVGEQTFNDALRITTKPIIASHSCAHALCPVPRNLKDYQIKAIAKNGGVIHINFFSGFLDSMYRVKLNRFYTLHQAEKDSLEALKLGDYEVSAALSKKYPAKKDLLRPDFSIVMDHIRYIVKMVGVDHVGIGSDFDGIDSTPKELNGVEDYPKITQALLKEGYSKKDIEKILGGNFLRVWKQNAVR